MTPLEDRTVPATVAVTLFATSVDADGLALGDDATDPHYELISNGGTALMPGAARTLTADGFPISPWVGNDPNSRWIVPIGTDGDGNAAVGTFAYRTTFDLTGIDPSTVTIAGQWAADNDATIVLNGVNTGVSMAAEDFQSLSAFSLSGGFRSGVNTLDFIVHNAGGPTGLRVAALTGSGESTDQVAASGVAFNTGVDAAGQPLAAGAIDAHWTVVDAPEASLLGATKVVPGDAYPFPVWVGNDGNSQWIAPQGAAADASASPGTYKYQTTLDLTGYDPSTAVLSGRWSADNEGVNVYLNGVPLNLSVTGANPGSGIEAYRGYADLYITNGLNGAVFLPGVNTLTFEVRNDQLSADNDAANPVGLRVDGLSLAAENVVSQTGITAIRFNGMGETRHGWVPVNNDNDNYNFYGDQETSLDQVYDKDELGQVVGENDLLAIHLYPIADAIHGDQATLTFNSPNIRLWANPDKSGEQIYSGGTQFDATVSHTVYVEGLNLSDSVGAEVVMMNWVRGVVPALAVPVGKVDVTVYKIEGAMDVPGYSRHTHNVPVPGKVAATAGKDDVAGGSLYAAPKGAPSADGGSMVTPVVVSWGGGPVVGTVQVKLPNGDTSPRREVNVVEVSLDTASLDSNVEFDDSRAAQFASRAGVVSSSDPINHPAMLAHLVVSRVAGPAGPDGKPRGLRFIDIGFMQTITVTSLHGDYLDTNQPFRVASGLEGKTYIDVADAARNPNSKPWYQKLTRDDAMAPPGSYRYKNFVTDDVFGPKTFSMSDSPFIRAVQDLTVDGDYVDRFSIVFNFNAYFVVHTKDKTNGADASYTIRAEFPWTWDASGTIDGKSVDAAGNPRTPTGKWTLALPPKATMLSTTSKVMGFTESTEGNIVPTSLFDVGKVPFNIASEPWVGPNPIK